MDMRYSVRVPVLAPTQTLGQGEFRQVKRLQRRLRLQLVTSNSSSGEHTDITDVIRIKYYIKYFVHFVDNESIQDKKLELENYKTPVE